MPDPSPLAPTLRDLLPLLLLSFSAGSLTQLTRLLARPGPPRPWLCGLARPTARPCCACPRRPPAR